MKRIATLAVILLMGLTASATSIRYFTESQAVRTVRYLNAQNEMMIYCGYDYEIETYVLINEVWMERVNSAYYEVWVFGYDAYTGDEIYMPLDLGCVWLFSAGRIYNAAQYLRFHATVHTPHFNWHIPPYNPYTRIIHRPGYVRSYHYDIHRHGWMPPAYHHGHGTHPPLPPYYMRQPGTPAPHPVSTWTPGTDRPVINTYDSEGRTGTAGRVTTGSSNGSGSSGVRTGGDNGGNRGTSTNGTTNTRGNSTSGTTNTRGTSTSGTTNTRGTSTSGTTNTRGTSTSGSTGGRGSATTGTTPTRGNTTSASGNTRGTSAAATTESSSDKPKTGTRGTSTSSSTSGRGTSTSGTTSNRGTSSSGRGTNNNR